MNERIRELYYECQDESQSTEQCYQKFAELIVRECLKACSRANEIRYSVPPTKGQVVVSCMREIEKHFGVEQ